MIDDVAGGEFAETPSSFPPLNLRLADLTSGNHSVHAGLRQSVPRTVHAEAKGLGFDPVFSAMLAVIAGAGLLQCLAVGKGLLCLGRADRTGENDGGYEQVGIHLSLIHI